MFLSLPFKARFSVKTTTSHVAKMLHALTGRGRGGAWVGRVRAGNRALAAYHKIDFAGKISRKEGEEGFILIHAGRRFLALEVTVIVKTAH